MWWSGPLRRSATQGHRPGLLTFQATFLSGRSGQWGCWSHQSHRIWICLCRATARIRWSAWLTQKSQGCLTRSALGSGLAKVDMRSVGSRKWSRLVECWWFVRLCPRLLHQFSGKIIVYAWLWRWKLRSECPWKMSWDSDLTASSSRRLVILLAQIHSFFRIIRSRMYSIPKWWWLRVPPA